MDFPLPAPIPGQRNSDRAPRGCNLTHDLPLLAALDGLGTTLNRERYHLLRSNYLTTFATECAPVSPTGLLPWGEHSYWNLHLRTIGNSYLHQYYESPIDAGLPTHHQLEPMPFRDWQTIHAANPTVLPRFVDGLDWHWDNEARTKFNRHAPITQLIRGYQVKRSERLSGVPHEQSSGSDFPGAAGCFIHNYACALALVDDPRRQWRDDLMDFCTSWWDRRLPSGLLPKSGGNNALSWNGASLGMTRSFAACLLEASDILSGHDQELAQVLEQRGTQLVQSVLDVEQPLLSQGHYVSSFNADGSPFHMSPPWAGNRGQAITAREVINVLNAAERIGDERGRAMALAAAEVYKESFLPRDTIVRAGDPGAVIGLLAECYRLTNDETWLNVALAHATEALELFFDAPLPRMAHGRQHYEAQQGSSILVHSLARLVCIGKGYACEGGLARPLVG
jgi:hypothetical protein